MQLAQKKNLSSSLRTRIFMFICFSRRKKVGALRYVLSASVLSTSIILCGNTVLCSYYCLFLCSTHMLSTTEVKLTSSPALIQGQAASGIFQKDCLKDTLREDVLSSSNIPCGNTALSLHACLILLFIHLFHILKINALTCILFSCFKCGHLSL